MTRLSLALNLRRRYSRTDRRTQQQSRAREQIFRSWSELQLWHVHLPTTHCSVAIRSDIRPQAADLFKAPSLQKNGIKNFYL
jgi:hypothetical protein